jgi:hypothetical protein
LKSLTKRLAALILTTVLLSGAAYTKVPDLPDNAELVQDDTAACENGLVGYKHWFNKAGTDPQIVEWLQFGLLVSEDEHGPVLVQVHFGDDASGGIVEAFVRTPAGIERLTGDELTVKYPEACKVFALQGLKGA